MRNDSIEWFLVLRSPRMCVHAVVHRPYRETFSKSERKAQQREISFCLSSPSTSSSYELRFGRRPVSPANSRSDLRSILRVAVRPKAEFSNPVKKISLNFLSPSAAHARGGAPLDRQNAPPSQQSSKHYQMILLQH